MLTCKLPCPMRSRTVRQTPPPRVGSRGGAAQRVLCPRRATSLPGCLPIVSRRTGCRPASLPRTGGVPASVSFHSPNRARRGHDGHRARAVCGSSATRRSPCSLLGPLHVAALQPADVYDVADTDSSGLQVRSHQRRAHLTGEARWWRRVAGTVKDPVLLLGSGGPRGPRPGWAGTLVVLGGWGPGEPGRVEADPAVAGGQAQGRTAAWT
jgi:hypothetical protein